MMRGEAGGLGGAITVWCFFAQALSARIATTVAANAARNATQRAIVRRGATWFDRSAVAARGPEQIRGCVVRRRATVSRGGATNAEAWRPLRVLVATGARSAQPATLRVLSGEEIAWLVHQKSCTSLMRAACACFRRKQSRSFHRNRPRSFRSAVMAARFCQNHALCWCFRSKL